MRDPEYRKAFVASQINFGIPFQIRALLKKRGKTQEWLAEMTGMLQPRISGLMSPGKTRPNIETLRRLAEAFDCGLAVRFVPFSELARWSDEFDPETFNVPDFADDLGFIERKTVARDQTGLEVPMLRPGGTTTGAVIPLHGLPHHSIASQITDTVLPARSSSPNAITFGSVPAQERIHA
jgi:transcriptional regulator with XRE-family HTH domain